jgi:uncharacterized protein (TIGR00290 family)
VSREPILLSWSGGKDSALTLAALRDDPSVEVVALLTTLAEGEDRIAVHGVRGALLRAQAAAAGLPLIEMVIPAGCGNPVYETAMAAAIARAQASYPRLGRVAFGDLFLEDIRRYREDRLTAAGIEALFPLWGLNTSRLARDFVERGFRARLVCVDTLQLDAAFAGEAFDAAMLGRLPPSVDPCGENGEFHTFVWDGPVFDRAIAHRTGERTLRDGRFAHCDLLPAAGT